MRYSRLMDAVRIDEQCPWYERGEGTRAFETLGWCGRVQGAGDGMRRKPLRWMAVRKR